MISGPLLSIELRHLRYFLAVVEELHFGHAAERVYISQPPLSKAIQKLEDQLGVQLLERTTRAVAPTKAGLVFAEEARTVLSSFDRAVAEAQRAGGAGAVLRIGCTHYIPIEWVQTLLRKLRERDPAVHPEVTHLLALEQVRCLRAGELDLGIFRHVQAHEGIEMAPLFPGEPLAAFLPPDHPLSAKQTVGPADLRDEVLLVFPRLVNPALHDWLLAAAEGAGYVFRDIRETRGAYARDLMLAVAEGLGVALAPSYITQVGDVGGGVVRRALDPAVPALDTVAAWRANPPRQLRPVLAAIREVARDLWEATERDLGSAPPDS